MGALGAIIIGVSVAVAGVTIGRRIERRLGRASGSLRQTDQGQTSKTQPDRVIDTHYDKKTGVYTSRK